MRPLPKALTTLALLSAPAWVAACSDSSDPGSSGGNTSFAGTWIGTATEDKGGGPFTPYFTVTLADNGGTLTGTFADSITTTYADSGVVAGTVSGSSATFTITLLDPPPVTRCSGTLTGTATIGANGHLTGNYGGRDCDFVGGGPDPNRTATFDLVKQ